MIIQINTDKTVSSDKREVDFFTSQISEDLNRFESHITRIEVHLKDENGKKEGFQDITCLMEARLEGRQPIAASNQADNVALAISGATKKLEHALKSIIGKLQNH